ncbi:DUF5655 domain-containing protein [Staphylococcus sp. Marseille-Q6910]|uniref:DUF5655 domain-containing protein n=1 Tax=Staphylococcus sp. Marseille-Q6910 TaxID=2937990 RepID=UPI00203E39EB|nr:DUF5655 domain-containing protein [Staphylococcus sp. Marseille-Q6910]
MGDIKLFDISGEKAYELKGAAVVIERSLQEIIEHNTESLLGITFLASEYTTGKKHSGRIDTLGIDENYSPVILEYKRATNENVINQGLFYLDWLMDHKAEFELLVMKKVGKEVSDKIDWKTPRLLCIAGGFTRYDEYAVQQINRNIELYRYKQFDNQYLMLDLINATVAKNAESYVNQKSSSSTANHPIQLTVNENIEKAGQELTDLYHELYDYLDALGDDVQVKELKYYIAFKRIKNFVCVEVYPKQNKIQLYVKVDLSRVNFESGFTRDVTNVGHYGTGNLSITIKNQHDLEKAKPYIEESYNNN